MSRNVAILRGINVSGQKKILMADLRALLEEGGFEKVKTYIQSGNIAFDAEAEADNRSLAKKIADLIQNHYQFEVPVLVRNSKELARTIANNPYAKENGIDTKRLYVTFLDAQPEPEKIAALEKLDFSPDRFAIIEQAVFLHCPVAYGRSKLSNNFFERKLKVPATTRNWKTVHKLLEMGSEG